MSPNLRILVRGEQNLLSTCVVPTVKQDIEDKVGSVHPYPILIGVLHQKLDLLDHIVSSYLKQHTHTNIGLCIFVKTLLFLVQIQSELLCL